MFKANHLIISVLQDCYSPLDLGFSAATQKWENEVSRSRIGAGRGFIPASLPRGGGWIAPTCRASAIGGLGVWRKEIICYSLAILYLEGKGELGG